MKTTDFDKVITSKVLNENLSKTYGSKINLEKYTNEQLENYRNIIRTKISQTESQGGFNVTLENDGLQKDKMVLDVINAHLAEREEAVKQFNENVDPKQAGVVQAAIDMQNKIKTMLEDLGSMMTKTMVALSDDIKDVMGASQAEQFGAIVTPALEAAMQHIQGTRASVEQGVAVLTGEVMPDTIGAQPDMAEEPMTDFDNDIEAPPAPDEFAASDAEAGGPEVAGREKRESITYRKPSITEANNLMFKLAK
jgi:hypothetical protein